MWWLLGIGIHTGIYFVAGQFGRPAPFLMTLNAGFPFLQGPFLLAYVATLVGSFGLFFMLFLLFVRYVPMVAMAEVKGVMPQADPHYGHGPEGPGAGGAVDHEPEAAKI